MKVGFWSESGKEIPIGNWRRNNKELYDCVIKFLSNPDSKMFYKGSSTCRICNKLNGSEDYTRDGITYPSGYVHYIRDHGVVPDHSVILAAVRRYGLKGDSKWKT